MGQYSADFYSKGLCSVSKMSHHFMFLILSIALHQSLGLFFGPPASECRSNSQCPSLGRSRCVKRGLIFCHQRESYTVSGLSLGAASLEVGLEVPVTASAVLVGVRNVNKMKTVPVTPRLALATYVPLIGVTMVKGRMASDRQFL